jgi:tRNA threonylcarbamoyl adenosine modification protein (Sua5/YciO/YrdC/YwlC family)
MSSPLRLQIDEWGVPPARKIAKVVEVLHAGGVAGYPTDSIYALGCALEAKDAIERIHRAKGMPKNHRMALICPDLSTASQYAHFNQTAFRLAQRVFPGPYTLIVPASREVPRALMDHKRRTVGIRVTSHPIAQAIVTALGRPLLTTSAISPATGEPCRDIDEVLEAFERCLDVVVEATPTEEAPSTVLEVDGDDIVLVRQGQGSIEGILD